MEKNKEKLKAVKEKGEEKNNQKRKKTKKKINTHLKTETSPNNIWGVSICSKTCSTQKRYTKLCLETEPYSFV